MVIISHGGLATYVVCVCKGRVTIELHVLPGCRAKHLWGDGTSADAVPVLQDDDVFVHGVGAIHVLRVAQNRNQRMARAKKKKKRFLC